MDRATRAKIDSLLYELRSWKPGECRSSADALAARFRLDPMMVQRIAEAEGVPLPHDDDDAEVDPNQATAVMSTKDLDLG
jgi:hypothetical protein